MDFPETNVHIHDAETGEWRVEWEWTGNGQDHVSLMLTVDGGLRDTDAIQRAALARAIETLQAQHAAIGGQRRH